MTVIRFWGKDILKRTDECVKVIEEAIFDNKVSYDNTIVDDYEIQEE